MMNLINRIPNFFCTAALVFTGALTPANAEELGLFEGSYFCVANASGGVSFNDTLNKWDSTGFTASGRYVVNVARHSETTDRWGKLRTVYTVTVSEHGVVESDYLSNICSTTDSTLRSYNLLTHFISDTGQLSCQRFGGDWNWKMNLENGRFMSTYVLGYLDGIDNNDNTPSIEIGTCSRIN